MAEIKDYIHSLNILEFTSHPVSTKTIWRWTFRALKVFSVLKPLCEFVQSLNPESEMHWEVSPAVRLLAASPNSRISGRICTNFICYGPHGDEQARYSHWHKTNLTHNANLIKKAEHEPQNNKKNVEFTLHFLWKSSAKLWDSFLQTRSICTDTLPWVLLIWGKNSTAATRLK